MHEQLAADDEHVPAPVQAPAPPPALHHRGARFPGEVIKQRRTFRVGLQFAPLAACIAMPAVLSSLLNPDLLYVRSLQLLALGAVIVAATGIYLLCHGLSRRSHRLRSMKFWLSIAANIIVIAAVAGAGARAYHWGHAPADVQSQSDDD